MPKAKMRVSLKGSLENAARCIDALTAKLREEMAGDHFEMMTERLQPNYNAFCLREISAHASGVESGEHSLEDFADHYCLKKTDVPVPQELP